MEKIYINLYADKAELESAAFKHYEGLQVFRQKNIAYINAVRAGYKPEIIEVQLSFDPE